MNLRYPLHVVLKPRADITGNPKQGYQWLHKRTEVLQISKKKEFTFKIWYFYDICYDQLPIICPDNVRLKISLHYHNIAMKSSEKKQPGARPSYVYIEEIPIF